MISGNTRLHLTIAAIIAPVYVSVSGCGDPTSPETAHLTSLKFVSSSASLHDQALLVGTGEGGVATGGTKIRIGVRGQPYSDMELKRWTHMSDEELTQAIASKGVDGRVGIGFKAAGREEGVDDEGEVLVSDEVVSRMTTWLIELGAEIVWQSSDLPHLFADIEPNVRLVGKIRDHENVEYIEPAIPGDRASRNTTTTHQVGYQTGGANGDRTTLAATIEPQRITGLQPGDSLRAVYTQPDGQVLSTTLVIEE